MIENEGLEEFRGTERFAIERRLGAGGFGVVYRAHVVLPSRSYANSREARSPPVKTSAVVSPSVAPFRYEPSSVKSHGFGL